MAPQTPRQNGNGFSASGWFNNLSPKGRQMVVLGGAGAALLALVFLGAPEKRPVGPSTTPVTPMGDLLGGKTDGKELGITGLSRDVSTIEQRLARLEAENARLREAQSRPPVPTTGAVPAATPAPAGQVVASAPPPPAPPQIRTIGEEAPSAQPPAPPARATMAADGQLAIEPPADEAKAPTVYLPSGSMMTGVLVTGLDAPTGRGAQGQPIPVLVRIKHEAILPSRFSADVREAFVLAEGYGDLASERAYLRAVRFSMVLANGKVIDVPIEMTAVGSDGKAGLRGRLVSKQGSAIAKASLAAFADSAGQALSRSNQYNAGGGIDPSLVGENAAYAGLGGAMQGVSDWYLKLADQMFPVIETGAGREVTFLLLKGVDLPLTDEADRRARR